MGAHINRILYNILIISNDSIIVKNLPRKYKEEFMKLANQMISDVSKPIQELCNKFVRDYTNDQTSLTEKLVHNKQWKEDNSKLKKITKNILNIL